MPETNKKILLNKITFAVIILTFCIYTGFVYTKGTEAPEMSAKAVEGKMLWQKHNCTACHQFYGLGGYLGPDLTNIISAEGKGAPYTKAMIMTGIKQMPKYNLSEDELNALIEFLTYVDQSGNFPEKNARMSWWGSFEINKKTTDD